MLILLMKKTNVLRLLLIIIISLVLGTFFLVFSFVTVQYIILMGKMPLLPRVLTLASLLPVPPLAVIFLALAYANIGNLKQEKEKEKENSSNLRICLSSVSIFLPIFLVFLSLTTMTMSNLTITSRMQDNWNSTRDHSYERECREEEQYYDNYGYYRTTTTTTVAPTEKPEKCFGKTLDQQVQDRMTFFSISQLTVSET